MTKDAPPVAVSDRIPWDTIVIDPDYNVRRAYSQKAFWELVESMRGGMVSPVVVEKTGEQQFITRAGHRRALAARVLRISDVPVRIFDKLTSQQRLEITLAENAT